MAERPLKRAERVTRPAETGDGPVRTGHRSLEVRTHSSGKSSARQDAVALEEPLEIRLVYRDDGRPVSRSISITMRTPGHDAELAVGFLFSEGVVRSPDDIRSAEHCGPATDDGLRNVIKVTLDPGTRVDLDRLERHFYTSSSCGVCGKTSLEAVGVQGQYDIATTEFRVAGDVLHRLPDALRERQDVFDRTGGLHASALFDASGTLHDVREDVGRHNALDKLIGSALMRGDVPLSRAGVIVSGRASFELVQKVMMTGCPLLAAVGAPSSLAVDLAMEFGITLVGFLKRDSYNVYTGDARVHGKID